MTTTTPTAAPADTLHRIEVHVKPEHTDARAGSVLRRARIEGLTPQAVRVSRVYFVQGPVDERHVRETIAPRLLTDAVVDHSTMGASPTRTNVATVEVHPLPGVMDPAAQSVREGVRTLLGVDVDVTTGTRYDFEGLTPEAARAFAERALANPVVHQICTGPWLPTSLPRGHDYTLRLGHVPLRALDDAALARLSREAHLFLSPDEMRAVRDEYRRLEREPTDIELETIAQTWSEHCVHKTLKSRIEYTGPEHDDALGFEGRPGHTIAAGGAVTIDNLLKSTVAAATFELIDEGIDWTLSVFRDNSGVIALDDTWGVCIKVETHNHPSALEPYGGAATGIGGCIRDIIGTGLGARPIASTDVFCVAHPDAWGQGATPLPPGTLHPRRILTDVVSGVRDYGNRMGIPTVNGAVLFHDAYVGNPLVFCGCVGLIRRDQVQGRVRAGDRIIALGGRTGRDGIHGATFSSAELESTHADEFSHAVQIGNAIEEKRTLDAIMRARDHAGGPLFSAITDCGAGGFSSAVGEMGKEVGAQVDLDKAPLKYNGLSYTEIWISEAQERLVLAVPPQNIEALRTICREEGVEMADLGVFGCEGEQLVLRYQGTEVGRLSMHFLHDGIPQPTRIARWSKHAPSPRRADTLPPISECLTRLLSHPNIASKHWIIRQYDHEVQGNTVVKPLVGPGGIGPSDGAVVEPIPGSGRGIAIACGLQVSGRIEEPDSIIDPYLTTLAAIDECVRNLVCVGADPARTAILDNFCWPSCEKPENLGTLVRAAEACYDGAKAYRTPFVSGKDSLNNQLRFDDPDTGRRRVIEIPPTLLITGLGLVRLTKRCTTMDAKLPGNLLVVVGAPAGYELLASHLEQAIGLPRDTDPRALAYPRTDLSLGPAAARAVAQCIQDGLVQSAHDCSDGGLLVAIAEMLIATAGPGRAGAPRPTDSLSELLTRTADGALRPLGAALTIDEGSLDLHTIAFGETPSRYVLEVRPQDLGALRTVLRDHGAVTSTVVGTITDDGALSWPSANLHARVNELAAAWRGTLDW
ncbi:MAG: phosphoribosylformylglycinamidine synthase subunit PurS [Phycisphaeraceae bacterium]|nr:phosphoribosylformylglycinamidine synthase subunit PurS [Phycisphaeraceae bacterium]